MAAICPRWGCLKKRAGKNREVSLKRPGVLPGVAAAAISQCDGGRVDEPEVSLVLATEPGHLPEKKSNGPRKQP